MKRQDHGKTDARICVRCNRAYLPLTRYQTVCKRNCKRLDCLKGGEHRMEWQPHYATDENTWAVCPCGYMELKVPTILNFIEVAIAYAKVN